MTETREHLRRLVLAYTIFGSQHQKQAFGLLESHLHRFNVEIKSITCDECGRTINDCVRWTNNKNELVDSWGFTEDSRTVCYHCDSFGGYIGDIYSPKKAL